MPVRRRPDIVERRLIACLKAYDLGGASVLLAFSGGSDSTALLRAAVSVSEPLGLSIHAAWVDHGIRPSVERMEERRFVENLTGNLGIPCDITEAPLEPLTERAANKGTSLEAEARAFRYRGLLEAARRFGCIRILTAHTKDDQAETLLFRVLTGSGKAGLRGIPESRPPFLRPFLTVTKRELLRYLESLGQDWREDSTNAEFDFLRNRIRGEIVPRLEEIVPGFRSALSAMAEKSRLDEDLLSRLCRESLPVSRTDLESSVPGDAFWRAHPALRLRALTVEAGRLAGEGRRVPYALIRQAALGPSPDGSAASARVKTVLAQGFGLKIVEEGESVRVVSCPDSPADGYGRKESSPDRETDPKGGFAFLFEHPGICRIDAGGSCRVYFRKGCSGPAAEAFDFPILVRSRRPGDRMDIRDGSKSVDELLSELAVRRELRDYVPILEDRRGILAILGTAVGGKDRYRHFSGVLDEAQPRLAVELKGFRPFHIDRERSAKAP